MCFDQEARPPIASIPPIRGGAIHSGPIALSSEDGTLFRAFAARSTRSGGAGVVILPDIRGLHPYYEELAVRFAERGIDAVAIDFFGRTAGTDPRPADFDGRAHATRTTFAGLAADIEATVDLFRSTQGGRARSLFSVGFCFGGRLSILAATLGLDLAGVVGFYGQPIGPALNDMPAPVDVAGRIRSPVLAIYGGADQGIPAESVTRLGRALEQAHVENRIVTYPGAPHSFFDRAAADFAADSDAAWSEVQAFITARTSA